ncbi:uncharacterized protein [Oscarella lobularis]|uniref:uncharacterized protein n=1 Tax=Oscarella lobularis TaxID=121494 RepID=UPI003313E3E3
MTGVPSSSQFKVVIHSGELAQIRQWVHRHQNIETGGDLFGLWSHENTAVIQFVLGPGKGSGRTNVSFFQNAEYLKNVGSILTERHGLCHIGEWHSHHRLGLAEPSSGDRHTVETNMPQYGWKRFIVFIANIPVDPIPNSAANVAGIGCFLFEDHGRRKNITMQRGDIELVSDQSPFRSFLGFSSFFDEEVSKNAEMQTKLESVAVHRASNSIPRGTYLLLQPDSFAHAIEGGPATTKDPGSSSRKLTFAEASSRTILGAVSNSSQVAIDTETLDQSRYSHSRLWSRSYWLTLDPSTQAFFEDIRKGLQGSLAKEPHAVIISFKHRVSNAYGVQGEHAEISCCLDYRKDSFALRALDDEVTIANLADGGDFLPTIVNAISEIAFLKGITGWG